MMKTNAVSMTFKEIREKSGMSLTAFSDYFGIPYRTVHQWEREERKCADYILSLIEFKLTTDGIIKKED